MHRLRVILCLASFCVLGAVHSAHAQEEEPAPPAAAARPAPNPNIVKSVVVYKTVGDKKLRLFIRKPLHPASSAQPAIIFIHGGGWVAGSINVFWRQADYFTDKGLVTIEIEYRLLQKGSTESPQICVEDTRSAVRWVRSHAKELGIDPNRIVLSGSSAGGFLAAFVSTTPGWDDPTDDLSVSTRGNALMLYFPVVDNSPTGYGNARFTDYKTQSPFFHVTKDAPPTLIMSGSEDKLIHVSMLEQYKSMFDKAGVRCDLHIFPGQGHGFALKEPFSTQTTQMEEEFLRSLHYLP